MQSPSGIWASHPISNDVNGPLINFTAETKQCNELVDLICLTAAEQIKKEQVKNFWESVFFASPDASPHIVEPIHRVNANSHIECVHLTSQLTITFPEISFILLMHFIFFSFALHFQNALILGLQAFGFSLHF